MTKLTTINRTLYRSLIRWTRSELARRVPFLIDTHVLPIEVRRFLPLTVMKIRNAVGVSFCVQSSYRSAYISKETASRNGYGYDPVGASLEALKFLSEFQQLLKEKDALRKENVEAEEYLLNLRRAHEFSSPPPSSPTSSSSSTLSHPSFSVPSHPPIVENRIFRIGDIVRHKVLGFRAVVIGWNVRTDSEGDPEMETLDTEHLPEVVQKELAQRKREQNYVNDGQKLDLLVDAFDIAELSRQGIDSVTPSCSVLSCNMERVIDPNLYRIHNSFTYKYFPIFDHEISRFIPNEELQYIYPFDYIPVPTNVNETSGAVNSDEDSSSIGREEKRSNPMDSVERILTSVAEIGEVLSKIFDKYHVTALLKLEGLSEEEIEEGEGLMRDIFRDVLDAVKICKNIKKKYDALPVHTESQKYMNEGDMIGSMCPTYMKKTYGVHVERLINPLYIHLDQAGKGTMALMDILFKVDQLLQLRLQNYGWKEIENILAGKYRTTVNRPRHPVDDTNGDMVKPLFELGDIVCHNKLGYTGAVRGWDYRPTIDCSDEWDLLEKKDDQWFYSIIPFDDSITQGTLFHRNTHMFYVAEESLTKVDHRFNHNEKLLSVSNRAFFEHFDESKQKYMAKPKLRFCFESAGM